MKLLLGLKSSQTKDGYFDEDIQSLFDEQYTEQQNIKFVSLKQASETGKRPYAEIVYLENGVERHGQAEGNGLSMQLSMRLKVVRRAGQNFFFTPLMH